MCQTTKRGSARGSCYTNTTEEQWSFALKPGQTGVDARWLGPGPSPFGPGIDFVELKPSSLSSMNKLSGQLQNWGTQGNTAVFMALG
jgi:hypothetical protein